MQANISRVNDVVNQMRGLGDTMPKKLVVGKILRSIGPRYNFVLATIGEAEEGVMARDNLMEKTSHIRIIFSVTIAKGLGVLRQTVGSKSGVLM